MAVGLRRADEALGHRAPDPPRTTRRARGRSVPFFGAKAALAAVDTGAVLAGMLVAAQIDTAASGFTVPAFPPEHLLLMAISVAVWPVVFARHRLYSSRFISRRVDELKRVASSIASGVLVTASLAFLFRITVPRTWLLMAAVLALVVVMIEREVARRVFMSKRRQGLYRRRVLVVGCNAEALEIAGMLNLQVELGYEVVGLLADDDRRDATPLHLPVLGTTARAIDAVVSTNATGVIIAATATDLRTSNRLIRELTDAGIHVELSSTLLDIAANRLTVRPLGRFPVVYIEPVQRTGWPVVAKRTFDLVLSALGLLITAPVLAVAALAIKLDSKGPVLFRQTRVGRNGEEFTVLKLRTMVADAEAQIVDLRARNEADGPLFKMKDDPRVTRVGKWLRKTSLDELPQLVNVLRGEMSLVGPRPALPREVAEWDPALHHRLRVKPGITGMWQVNGRSSSSFEEYVRLDLYYVDNWSFLTDVMILLKTVPAVLASRGAY